MLGELLDILLDNACKHSPPESPITVRLRREEAAVCFDVEDRGYGIGDEDVPQLFTPFYRSADARRRGAEGVGLGLSIAKRLADAFGGSLSVRSRIGQGSCFTLSLPAHAPAEVGLTSITTATS
jgi:signal transduction histidine kinase